MNLLSDIITYVRRIIKSPSNAQITDNLIIDYINRFWLMDVDARIQLFDLKTTYQFQTVPGVDKYNMPLYNLQTEGQAPTSSINYYPVYQGFLNPAYINGITVPMETEQNSFYDVWPDVVQQLPVIAVGNGGNNYTFQLPLLANYNIPPNPPLNGILRGHIDLQGIIDYSSLPTFSYMDPPVVTSAQALTTIPAVPTTSVESRVYITSIDATGANVVVADSGQFLTGNVNYGLLMEPGEAPYGNTTLAGGYSTTLNTINYFTGVVNVTFPVNIPVGNNINVQCLFFQSGLPRGILYYNNTLTLRSPPALQYLVKLTAYLSPCAYMTSTAAVQFAYMAEYIARGAARKILADTGDTDQFQFYEPLFREQEILVWKRSQRQFTSTRTQTIYSAGINQGQSGFNNTGGSTL